MVGAGIVVGVIIIAGISMILPKPAVSPTVPKKMTDTSQKSIKDVIADQAPVTEETKPVATSMFSAAVTAAGLDSLMAGQGPFTIFAPSDEAFEKLPENEKNALLANTEKLKSVLLAHIVPASVPSSDFETVTELTPIEGEKITLQKEGNVWKVNGKATIVQQDVQTTNGLIHVIDTILQ
jgi:uncharacterized surface protein with fasciclin (FAS1) repeats